jgi:RNA polymerase sigma factor (TIGR02999 family)
MGDVTMVLQALEDGGKTPSEDLLPLVYDELRRVAAARMAREPEGQTLQPTALVHEAWLQLVGNGGRTWKNRAHFFGAAADAMRRILIDSARRKAALKRGGGQSRASLDDLELAATLPDEEILLIDEALERLEAEDPERARVVTLKFYGGLTNEEVAKVLGVSLRTVVRHWTLAKIKLFRWIQTQTRE